MEARPRNIQDTMNANVFVPYTTAHLQRSYGVYTLMGQSCFSGTRATYTVLDQLIGGYNTFLSLDTVNCGITSHSSVLETGVHSCVKTHLFHYAYKAYSWIETFL